MTTPLTISEIERRLRYAAPDEPTVLPALVLPTAAERSASVGVRFRAAQQQGRGLRPAYVVGLLVLALAAGLLAVGAVRLLSQDPLANSCNPYGPGFVDPTAPACRAVAVPDGWVELGSGQLFPGDFTEEGLAYEVVDLVMANVSLGGCASPGGPMPTGIPVGSNEVHVPAPTPDAGLACLRAAPLPSNGIRVEAMHGIRITGLDAGGAGVPDISEPTREAGWTEVVDGRPARLTVVAGADPGGPAETRTWDVLLPGSIDGMLRLRADIAGPDVDAGRAAVQRIVDAVEFKTTAPPLDPAMADEVLRAVLDNLERTSREAGSDLYGCFPREPGSTDATIRGGFSGPLAGALDVTCTVAIRESLAEVWRIVLDVGWAATETAPGDSLHQEFFTTGETFGHEVLLTGGYTVPASGRDTPEAGVDGWFPNAGYALPARLTGPLDLPPGAIVRMLWPAENPQPEPGADDDVIYPSKVNTHLYVVAGPVGIDGEAWYRVQGNGGSFEAPGWVRGTRDGRPQLEVIEPACPDGALTVGDITWLIDAERLLCFGSGEIALDAAILVSDEAWAAPVCADERGGETACPDPIGDPGWLTGFPRWKLYGVGGKSGPEPGLFVWLDPSIAEPSSGQTVRIRGHFDDPAAAACRLPNVGGSEAENDPAMHALICRERFVITAIEPR